MPPKTNITKVLETRPQLATILKVIQQPTEFTPLDDGVSLRVLVQRGLEAPTPYPLWGSIEEVLQSQGQDLRFFEVR